MAEPLPPKETDDLVQRVLEDYGRFVSDGMARLYRFMGFTTLEWENSGAVLKDVHGKEYIDCGGYGVFFHGHRHPRVVAAVKAQLDLFPLSNRLLPQKPVVDLARLLAQITPGNLQYSFFCNSGTEAVEGALKLARAYTGRKGYVAAYGGFHGKSYGALSASGRELYREPFYPLLPGFTHVPFADIAAMDAAVTEDTAAVILEPIQGEAGVQVPPDDYLPRVREICNRRGALLILDEVQTGLGRTGKMFACEHWGVSPDILCMAKALGGGVMPIGAFIATPEVFEPFNNNPYLHSSTFGGNPLACAAGCAAISTIQEEGLVERAATLGAQALFRLGYLVQEYPKTVAAVRGKGLLIGIEFTKEGALGLFISTLLDKGVIVTHSLNQYRVARVMPPAVIPEELLDRALTAVTEAVAVVNEAIDEL
ncbi:MAG: aminotransferase class III-fold pyridoxal phosphate-dependent enzyme [Bacillota bacterium]